MKSIIKISPLIAFILPILTVLISYYLSIKFDYVQFCIPNIDGCTSISQVGRYPPINYFFKTFMFISIFIIFIYWKSNYTFFQQKKVIKKFI